MEYLPNELIRNIISYLPVCKLILFKENKVISDLKTLEIKSNYKNYKISTTGYYLILNNPAESYLINTKTMTMITWKKQIHPYLNKIRQNNSLYDFDGNFIVELFPKNYSCLAQSNTTLLCHQISEPETCLETCLELWNEKGFIKKINLPKGNYYMSGNFIYIHTFNNTSIYDIKNNTTKVLEMFYPYLLRLYNHKIYSYTNHIVVVHDLKQNIKSNICQTKHFIRHFDISNNFIVTYTNEFNIWNHNGELIKRIRTNQTFDSFVILEA